MEHGYRSELRTMREDSNFYSVALCTNRRTENTLLRLFRRPVSKVGLRHAVLVNRSLVWKGFKKRPLLLYMKIGVRGRRIGMHILTPVGESSPFKGGIKGVLQI